MKFKNWFSVFGTSIFYLEHQIGVPNTNIGAQCFTKLTPGHKNISTFLFYFLFTFCVLMLPNSSMILTTLYPFLFGFKFLIKLTQCDISLLQQLHLFQDFFVWDFSILSHILKFNKNVLLTYMKHPPDIILIFIIFVNQQIKLFGLTHYFAMDVQTFMDHIFLVYKAYYTLQIFLRFFAFWHNFKVLHLVAKKLGFRVFAFSYHFATNVSNEK